MAQQRSKYKKQQFVEAYIKFSMNGTAAARSLGFSDPGDVALEYLRDAEVKQLLSERYAAAAMASDEVLARLARFAREEIGTTGEQLDALKTLARGHGLLTDRVEHTGVVLTELRRVLEVPDGDAD